MHGVKYAMHKRINQGLGDISNGILSILSLLLLLFRLFLLLSLPLSLSLLLSTIDVGFLNLLALNFAK